MTNHPMINHPMTNHLIICMIVAQVADLTQTRGAQTKGNEGGVLMKSTLALISRHTPQPVGAPHGQLAQRILLHPDELYRVPPTYRQVRTSHGVAHISHGGRDLIVRAGESANLEQSTEVALVSPLHRELLVMELFV